MDWDIKEIFKSISAGGAFALLAGIVAKKMDWIRFGKSDTAKIGDVNASTESKLSDAALQWTVNLASRNEKMQKENDRLHDIIDKMRDDFDEQILKIKTDFNERITKLENELRKSKDLLVIEREENQKEIKRLKNQANG